MSTVPKRVKPIITLCIALPLLTGCPPPSEYEQFKRIWISERTVKDAMLACGFNLSVIDNRTTPDNEIAKRYLCMEKKGFKPGFRICDVDKDLPACIEEKQGFPVSLAQLESLPFRDDPGFWKFDDHGMGPHVEVPWRASNASQHYSQRTANQIAALAVMYECGYPNPLGSGATVNIGEAARVQTCMQRKGFVPERTTFGSTTMIPICTQYPELPACRSLQ